jgi:hypothetical protein
LQPDIVLQGGFHFPELWFVVVAPRQTLRDVLLHERVLNLFGDKEQVDVGQILDASLQSNFLNKFSFDRQKLTQRWTIILCDQYYTEHYIMQNPFPLNLSICNLFGQTHSGLVVSCPEEMFDEHPIDASFPPLALRNCARRHATGLK